MIVRISDGRVRKVVAIFVTFGGCCLELVWVVVVVVVKKGGGRWIAWITGCTRLETNDYDMH